MAKVKWALDPTHAEIHFKVKHLMISNVSGKIGKFDVTVETEGEDFTTAKVALTAEVASITTGNEQRDGHLQSSDFFDAANSPQIKFTVTKIEKESDQEYKISGDLTVREVTKQVKFDAEFGGIAKDPWGNIRAGLTVEGKINRKEFGLVWNALTEAGGLVVGDDVKLHAEFEFIKQA